MSRVIAVVLTYNRKELLKRCLEAIQLQTRPCDDVIVINNASTDGTLEMLESGEHEGLHVYTLKKNVGAAGGFNAGFRMGYENGADHVWMMDDDVIPQPTALEELLEADAFLEKKGRKRAYLLSTAYTEEGQITNTPQLNYMRNQAGYPDWPAELQHGLAAVGSGSFVSILVPRRVLDEYGLPISSMFIWGEDAEYTLRITRDAPGYLVGSSKVAHIRHGGGTISIVKETNPIRIGYYKNFVRNNIYVARTYKTRRRVASIFFKNFWLAGKMLLKGKFKKACVISAGVLQGMWFHPEQESIDSQYDYTSINKSQSTGERGIVESESIEENKSDMFEIRYARQ
jgi:dTDP-4-dehydrorhamnose reductase